MITGGISALTNGQAAFTQAKISSEKGDFSRLLQSLYGSSSSGTTSLSSSQILENGKLNGDYSTGFSGTFTSPEDKNAIPVGAAVNQGRTETVSQKIDRTSKLYESCLEMESYLVKMMVSQMRKTVVKANGEGDFASKMYEDMLYDEYAVSMTKNAGFGLADQMYIQMSRPSVNVEA